LVIRVCVARSDGRWLSGPNVEVRRDEIGEPAIVQAGQHLVAHDLERPSQQRTDQRRLDLAMMSTLVNARATTRTVRLR
jgi:hypothetical protein